MSSKRFYVGLASTFHDPALAIVDDKGQIVFAEATERHFQNKRAMGCPADNVVWMRRILQEYCDTNSEFIIAKSWSTKFLANLKFIFNLGLINKYPRPFVLNCFIRIFKMMLPFEDMKWLLLNQLGSNITAGETVERNLRHYFNNHNIKFKSFDHHLTHAMYACHGSGYDNAICTVVDGGGELGSLSVYKYDKGKLVTLETHKGPESLGFYYMLLTKFCGFDPIEGEEWKVMGLAPYGKYDENLYTLLARLLGVADCTIQYKEPIAKYNEVRSRLLSMARKENESPLASAAMAFTGQQIFEELMTELLNNIFTKYRNANLVLTGGCALNSAYNGKVLEKTNFKNLYIPSAPGDDGNAIGAALCAYREDHPEEAVSVKNILSPYSGSRISSDHLTKFIEYSNLKSEKLPLEQLCRTTAQYLAEGKIIGWIQGRAEFGPRALGNRSILADPRREEIKDEINKKVKYREEYRPFAPSILDEYGDEYFYNYQSSPYMERTLEFKPDVLAKVPAVVHVNGTGRLQTVKKEWNEKYYTLIKSFYDLTGIPVLLNTSFNVMGKPIVHSVNDALSVFFTSGLDVLVIEDYIFLK